MICFTNENSISISFYEILDPFTGFGLFLSLPHAICTAGALPEREEQSRPGTLKEEEKQLNLDSNRAHHAPALVMGKESNAASWSRLHLMIFKVTKSGRRSLVDVGDEVSHALPEWGALEISGT